MAGCIELVAGNAVSEAIELLDAAFPGSRWETNDDEGECDEAEAE